MGFLQSWTASVCTHLLWFLTVTNPATTLGQDGLLECLGTSHIATVPPGSPDFPQDSLAFNRRLQYTPAAIVFPTSAQEVSAAVLCAADAGIHVAARSGGHNYGAFSLGGQNGSLVVDLSKMNKIVVNANGTASFQTGNRLGDVALTLFNNGERAMAHGTCRKYLPSQSPSLKLTYLYQRTLAAEDMQVAEDSASHPECGGSLLTKSSLPK